MTETAREEAKNVKFSVHDDAADLGAAAAALAVEAIETALAERGRALVLLAAAPSQLPVLAELARRDLDHSRIDYFHMDEYVGLPVDSPRRFGNWLISEFFEAIDSRPVASFHRLPAGSTGAEIAASYTAELPAGPFDLVLCGIGMNAHIAFNDPGCDFDDPQDVRVVDLAVDSRLQQVREGLFAQLDDVPTQAVTLTVPRLMRARRVVCSVLGEVKRAALAEVLDRDPTNQVPATVLKLHPDAYLLADTAARG